MTYLTLESLFKHTLSVLLFLLGLVVFGFFSVKQHCYAQDTISKKSIESISDSKQLYLKLLRSFSYPVKRLTDYQPLINKAANAEIVLIGDSTHGTHEFYQQRIEITKQLITQKNFKLVAIEADWINTHSLNQYIHSEISYAQLRNLNPFNKYPSWVWKNKEVLDFLHWLRQYNQQLLPGEQKVNLFGLDIYSYNASIKWVLDYIAKYEPKLFPQAKANYQCLMQFPSGHQYGLSLTSQLSQQPTQPSPQQQQASCEKVSKAQLELFSKCVIKCGPFVSISQQHAYFHAQQQAFTVQNIEHYYRAMYLPGQLDTWNIRDQHMFDSLMVLRQYYQQSKAVVWAHSSHLGNAKATTVSDYGQLNIGQLLQEALDEKVFAIGMLTYKGQVVASDDWDSPIKIKNILPAHEDSVEALFNAINIKELFLVFDVLDEPTRTWLNQSRYQRHIGIIYIPENEMKHHYNNTHLVDQFDAIVFIAQSTALQALEQY